MPWTGPQSCLRRSRVTGSQPLVPHGPSTGPLTATLPVSRTIPLARLRFSNRPARLPPPTVERHAPPSRFISRASFPRSSTLWERMALLVQRNLARDRRSRCDLESVSCLRIQSTNWTGDFEAVVIEFVVGNSASRPYTSGIRAADEMYGATRTRIDAALDDIRHCV